MEKIKMTAEQKAEIDAMTHEDLARAWRFGTNVKDIWFTKAYEASDYFRSRLFSHFGGITSEISKKIGW